MNNIKLVSISFILEKTVSPFLIKQDLDEFFQKEDCVILLEAYRGNKIVCHFWDESVSNQILSGSKMIIAGKMYPYKLEETNIRCVQLQVSPSLATGDIVRKLRQFGKVLTHDRNSDTQCFTAVIDLLRNVPRRLTIKNEVYEVVGGQK